MCLNFEHLTTKNKIDKNECLDFLNHSLVSFAIFKIFAIQYVLMIELNRYYKKDKVSKKWMWYLLNAMYVTVLLWNITIVSLRALGISE